MMFFIVRKQVQVPVLAVPWQPHQQEPSGLWVPPEQSL